MRLPQLTLLASAIVASLALYPAPSPRTQEDTAEEIVANLAAGRVLIAVFKDAIAIGTIENKVESSAELPLIVPISSERVGILLGAVDWFSPSTRTSIADLPRETEFEHYCRECDAVGLAAGKLRDPVEELNPVRKHRAGQSASELERNYNHIC